MTGALRPRTAGRIGPHQRLSEETLRATELNWHSLGPGELALSEFAAAGIETPDLDRIRRYRLGRVKDRLVELDYAGIVLYDPVHIRQSEITPRVV